MKRAHQFSNSFHCAMALLVKLSSPFIFLPTHDSYGCRPMLLANAKCNEKHTQLHLKAHVCIHLEEWAFAASFALVRPSQCVLNSGECVPLWMMLMMMLVMRWRSLDRLSKQLASGLGCWLGLAGMIVLLVVGGWVAVAYPHTYIHVPT